MSAKKGWDIERRPARTPTREAVASRAGQHSTRNVTIARGAQKKKEPGQPLKVRRKKKRQFLRVLFLLLGTALVVGAFYVLWLPTFRVTEVTAIGPDSETVQAIVQSKLQGSYFWILPHNSLFLIPQTSIRKNILASFADVEAVSISAHGLHAITVTNTRRVTAFWWCGETREAPAAGCYEADADGLLFAAVDPLLQSASTTPVVKIYMPISAMAAGALDPLRAHVANTSVLPTLLRMVKALRSLNADIVSVVIRTDEADMYTSSGTRITYVLGHEEQAAMLAATAFPTLNLNDGSVEYVELRFDGKVYFKKKGAS